MNPVKTKVKPGEVTAKCVLLSLLLLYGFTVFVEVNLYQRVMKYA
jgi:hypothetical protein